MDNFFEINIKADLKNVSVVRVAVSAFLSNIEITLDDLMDIKTAVSEAVTNSIEHGYEKILTDKSDVKVRAHINEDIDSGENIIKIEIEDLGIGIDDIELATTPAYTSKPELEHAGMGFTIMETFMDEVFIDSKLNEGTTITLTKVIKNKRSNVVWTWIIFK